jgi:8-oxo-dGTP pyrophosphatase MutT (NUDIX family)
MRVLKSIIDTWRPGQPEIGTAPQYGVLPYRLVDGKPAYLLITSRRSGRWIFPKGGLIKGLTPAQSAAVEALEEAGVEGTVADQPIGRYRSTMNDASRSLVDVEIFAMVVERQHNQWQEKKQRHRHWVTLPEAKRLLRDRDKVALVVALEQRLVRAAA